MSSALATQPDTLSPTLLDDDQQAAITRLVEHDHTLLIAGMGAGKTVIAATAILELLETGVLERVLIVAPLKTAQETWPAELAAWEHLQALDVAYALGNARKREAALRSSAPVVVINFDNLAWAVKSGHTAGFDGLLIDESSKMKTVGNESFKPIRRKLGQFKWRVCMSGTPVSEGWKGLYGQMLLVDGGATLGRRWHQYLERWFFQVDFQGYKHELRPESVATLARKIRPYVHVVPDYRGTLPLLEVETVPVALPVPARDLYRRLAADAVLDGVTAANGGALRQKLQQVAAGFVYTDDGSTQRVHDRKWGALRALLEDYRDAGENVIVVYWWAEQREELASWGVPLLSPRTLAEWNAGRLPVLGLHPQSGGHGLNLQRGGHRMIWLSPCPLHSRDLHDQTIARLWRRGQAHAVGVDVLVATGTVDEVVWGVIEGKADHHALLMAHLETVTGCGARE